MNPNESTGQPTTLWEIKRTIVETFQVRAKDKTSAAYMIGLIGGPAKVEIKSEVIKKIREKS